MEFKNAAAIAALLEEGTQIIDTRPLTHIADIAIANSIYIPWGENFLKTFQLLIADDVKVVLIAEESEAVKIHRTIAGSGFTGLKGITLESETEQLKKTVIITIEPDEFAIDFNHASRIAAIGVHNVAVGQRLENNGDALRFEFPRDFPRGVDLHESIGTVAVLEEHDRMLGWSIFTKSCK